MDGNARDGTTDAPVKAGARIAFFGGSFDPPHLGHLAVARAARAAFQLDSVLFAPVGAQPLKPKGSRAGFADRLAMTRLAIAGEPGFAVSFADAPRLDGKPNFTFETLLELRAGLGSHGHLFCLMGADSFFGLREWHRAAEIPFVAPLIVASRPGEPMHELQAALPQGFTLSPVRDAKALDSGVDVLSFCVTSSAGETAPFYVLPGLHVEISASEIRRQLQAGIDPATGDSPSSLPASVAEYVQAHRLYR
jgi:nicotinate-nucleotide adenylyltransferase